MRGESGGRGLNGLHMLTKIPPSSPPSKSGVDAQRGQTICTRIMPQDLCNTSIQVSDSAALRVLHNKHFAEAVHLSITRIASFVGAFGKKLP